jgi:hypothetical protein
MVQILQGKLSEAEEDNFDLRANMATIEAEIKYESDKLNSAKTKQIASLESSVSFLSERFKNSERDKVRALRALQELQEKQLVEQKRLDAEKRLLATKKRKHESAVMAASQRMSQAAPVAATPATVSPPAKASGSSVAVEVQTDPLGPRERLTAENAELLATLMATASRDLLILFKGSSELDEELESEPIEKESADPARRADSHSSSLHASDSRGSQLLSDSGVSQSVFSQIAGHAHAQVQASLRSFAQEVNMTQAAYVNERARDLHDALASMIQGDATALAVAPVLVKYLTAPSDLETDVLCSVLRLLYIVIVHSECFQEFLLLAPSGGPGHPVSTSSTGMDHPRISFPGLRFTSMDDYLASKKDDLRLASRDWLASQTEETQLAERIQMRAKLLSALCRVIQNNTIEPRVVDAGLSVLSLWVDLGVIHRTPHADFKTLVTSNVLQEIVLAPKGVTVPHKARALQIVQELVHFRETFPEVESSARRTLFFNRCARLLGGTVPTVSSMPRAALEAARRDLWSLQHATIGVFMTIVVTYPSTGIRFVLESTHGQTNEDDHDHSVIYYLTQLLHNETFDARTLGLDALDELLENGQRLRLVQDAFTLLSLLARYVDLSRELGKPHDEDAFMSVLYLLSSAKFDVVQNNTISKTAAALITLVQPSLAARLQ